MARCADMTGDLFSPPAIDWRITLRPGMVAAAHPLVKVFTSPAAFEGYVGGLRLHGVDVSFSSPYVATCKDAS